MARLSLEDRLARLNALRDTDPRTLGAVDELRAALKLASNHVVARAAQIIGEAEITELTDALINAFERYFALAWDKDKTCAAKTACAEALYQLDAGLGRACDAVFWPGVTHVQLEPVFGGKADTAVDLRGACAMGLVRSNDPRALVAMGDLLADPEPMARAAAARAIGYRGRVDGVPLLRLRVRSKEDHHDVLTEAFTSLIELEPDEGLAFIEPYLQDTLRAAAAAIAIGQSKHERALGCLKDWHARSTDAESRRNALIAIAMQRSDSSRAFLLDVIARARESEAGDAVRALAVYRHEPGLEERVHVAAQERGLDQLVVEAFGS